MGYPGDQQPPRQPHHPPDPRRRDLPPYPGGDDPPFAGRHDAPPHGGGQPPYQREQPPYQEPGQPPHQQYSHQQLSHPREQSPYAREHSPYGGEHPPYAGRREAGPYEQESRRRVEELATGRDPEAAAGPPGHDWDARRQPAAPRPDEPEWDPDARGPLWRRLLIFSLALLAMIGVLFAGLWYAAHNQRPPAAGPAPTTRPSPPVSGGPLTKYGYAASRATDRSPLSLRELFGKRKLVKDKRTYVRTVTRREKKCADGVTGDKITKALKAGACTQLLRASFADAKGTVIGTVGVANLRTSAAAKKVASAGGGGERKDYLKPLPGKDEATKHLGTGDAYAGGWTYGHYAVLLWFQFKDGHKPDKAELKRLYQTAVDVTDTTVFPALDTRALTGGHG